MEKLLLFRGQGLDSQFSQGAYNHPVPGGWTPSPGLLGHYTYTHRQNTTFKKVPPKYTPTYIQLSSPKLLSVMCVNIHNRNNLNVH